jgi:tetratricopeptide (TPR) repeat protein
VTSLLLVLVLLATPSEALSRAHFAKAQKSFAQHDWRRALDEFTAASESAPAELPDLYFDIAQCHRNLGHARQAVMAFEKYLALKPDAADKQKVRALIVQLGGRAIEDAPAPAVEDAAPPVEEVAPAVETATATAPPTATATATATATPVNALTEPTPQKVTPKKRWPIWVGVAAGVGLTAIAVGVGVGVGTSSSGHGATTPMGTPMLGSAGTFDTRGH